MRNGQGWVGALGRASPEAGFRLGIGAGVAIAVAAVALLAAPSGANAQSLFEAIFGPGAAKPGSRPAPPSSDSRGRAPAGPVLFAPWLEPFAHEPQARPMPRASYRTVCVRLCDGYYFPVSFATTSSRLRRDGLVCERQCGAETRLFHMPAGREIDDAVDASGRRYTDLKTAFQYRKALVKGCACRPEPWSAEEGRRHASYGGAEGNSVLVQRPSVTAGDAPARDEATEGAGVEMRVADISPEPVVQPEGLAAPQPRVRERRAAVRRGQPSGSGGVFGLFGKPSSGGTRWPGD